MRSHHTGSSLSQRHGVAIKVIPQIYKLFQTGRVSQYRLVLRWALYFDVLILSSRMHFDDYCQDVLKRSGSSFYWAIFLLRPVEKRRALTAVYAWCRQMDDVVDHLQEPQVASIKLNWWLEEIHRCYTGRASHPITQAIAHYLPTYAWPIEWFEDLIQAMRSDLQPKTYANIAEVMAYAHGAAGVVGQMSATIFGFQHVETLAYAHELGLACQMTNILRDVGEDLRRGRCYLPMDELETTGVDWPLLSREYVSSSNFELFMRQQVARNRDQYQKAMTLLHDDDRAAQKTGLMMAAIYQRLLDELETEGLGRVLQQKLSLSWRSKCEAILPVLLRSS